MQIGTWGDFVFECRHDGMCSPEEIGQTASGRWGVHEPINTLVKPQFGGPGQGGVTLRLVFSTMLGVDPQERTNELIARVNDGTVNPLIIDGTPLSQSEYYLANISSTAQHFERGTGHILASEMTCTFSEYN